MDHESVKLWQEKEWSERMVTFQVSGESLGWLQSMGSWLHESRKRIQEQAIVKWEKVCSGSYTLHRQSVDHLRRQEALGETHSMEGGPSQTIREREP